MTQTQHLSIKYIYLYLCYLCVFVYHFHLPAALFIFAVRCSLDITSLPIIFCRSSGQISSMTHTFCPWCSSAGWHSSLLFGCAGSHHSQGKVCSSWFLSLRVKLYLPLCNILNFKRSFFLKTPRCFLCAAGKRLVFAGRSVQVSAWGRAYVQRPVITEGAKHQHRGKVKVVVLKVCFLPLSHTPSQGPFSGRGGGASLCVCSHMWRPEGNLMSRSSVPSTLGFLS